MQNRPKRAAELLLWNLISGGTAGLLSLFFAYPLDTARTLMVYDFSGKRYTGIIDCLSQVVHKRGFWGLYSGFQISVLGTFIFRFLQIGLYAVLKPLLGKNPYFVLTYFFGLFVTTFAALVCYPIDTVRRVQVVHGLNARAAFDHTMRGGWTQLFAGIEYYIFRTIVGSMVFIGYESVMRN